MYYRSPADIRWRAVIFPRSLEACNKRFVNDWCDVNLHGAARLLSPPVELAPSPLLCAIAKPAKLADKLSTPEAGRSGRRSSKKSLSLGYKLPKDSCLLSAAGTH